MNMLNNMKNKKANKKKKKKKLNKNTTFEELDVIILNQIM